MVVSDWIGSDTSYYSKCANEIVTEAYLANGERARKPSNCNGH